MIEKLRRWKKRENATLSTKIYANDIFLFNESHGLLLSENLLFSKNK